MSLCCSVCGEPYVPRSHDRGEWCPDCATRNFTASQDGHGLSPDARNPPAPAPGAREALEAFVAHAEALTPRQVEAMARMAEAWRRQEEDA